MQVDWLRMGWMLLLALVVAGLVYLLALPTLPAVCLAACASALVPALVASRRAGRVSQDELHAFVQRLIDAIPEPVYIKSREARFLWVNEAFAEERRRPAHEIIGLTSYDLAPNASASTLVSTEDADVLRGKWVSKEQHTTYPVTGEECYRLVSKRLCTDTAGVPLIVGAHFDITRIRQAEARLQDTLEREISQRQRVQTYMQRLVDVIPQPVYVKDAQSRYLLVNQAFCKYRELEREELIGKTPFDLSIDPAYAQRVWDEDHHVLNGGVIAKEECSKHPVTGKDAYRYVSKGCCTDADGQLVVVGANFDITAWREAELRWQHASTAKSQFLAVMSHEIRTPLSGVIGTLRLALKDSQIAGGSREYLDMALVSAESLLSIISDILDFSKIEAGQLQLESISFDLHATAREVLKGFQEQARQRDIPLELDIAPDAPQFCLGDPTRIRQILINLVGNALKFTERGGVNVSLTAKREGECMRVQFAVRDTGIGIPSDVLPRLFQVFQQADTSTTRRFGGTGLGLAICRQLVEAMGGAIKAESLPGQGSTFSFDLLLAPGEALSAPKAEALLPHRRQLIVLCAEDLRVNQLVIRAQLSHLGHVVEMVETGLAAIQALAAKDYDLVLMDGRMPEMDGEEATRVIRAGGLADCPVRNPAIPIIALTANASSEDRDQYLAAGMNDYLSKPVREPLLHAALSRVIVQLEAAGN